MLSPVQGLRKSKIGHNNSKFECDLLVHTLILGNPHTLLVLLYLVHLVQPQPAFFPSKNVGKVVEKEERERAENKEEGEDKQPAEQQRASGKVVCVESGAQKRAQTCRFLPSK